MVSFTVSLTDHRIHTDATYVPVADHMQLVRGLLCPAIPSRVRWWSIRVAVVCQMPADSRQHEPSHPRQKAPGRPHRPAGNPAAGA